MPEFYSLPKANRIIAVELANDGSVRPLLMSQNDNGVLVLHGPTIENINLKEQEKVSFEVHVPRLGDRKNFGMLSHEFSNWGPKVYQFTTVSFLGTTWPFGQEIKTKGTSPESGHVDIITYTLEQVSRKKKEVVNGVEKETGEDRSVLTWSSVAGATQFSGSVDLVADAGGASAYVSLRLSENCSGWINFLDRKFAGENSFSVPDPSAKVAAARAGANSSALRTAVAAQLAPVPQLTSLGAALAAIAKQHELHWKTALDVVPADYLDPVRDAIYESAQAAALAALRANTGTEAGEE